MNRIGRVLTLAVAAGVSSVALAQQSSSGSLLVLSKRGHDLALVDPSSLKVLATVPVGDDPHEVIASEDGTKAYVSNYGGGSLHTISVVDLGGKRALPPIELGPLNGPHGLTFVDGKLWFTAEGAKAIGRYDPATQKVDWILGTGQNRTHMIYVAPGGQHVVTTNVSSGTVSLIDRAEVRMQPPPPGGGPGGPGGPRMDWNQVVVRVGDGAEGFDVSPDGKEVWVANARDGTISVIDLSGKKVVATLQANVSGANRLKFTTDGAHVLVSTLNGPDLTVLDAHTRKEVKRVAISRGAAGILIQPDGARAYVAGTPDDYVAVIDLKTLTVVGHIASGEEPDGLAWAVAR